MTGKSLSPTRRQPLTWKMVNLITWQLYETSVFNVSTKSHYSDVIVNAMASEITGVTIGYSTVSLGADQRKHESSVPLAFVRGIHRWSVNSPHKGPVTRKMIPFDDVIMANRITQLPGNTTNTQSGKFDHTALIILWWRHQMETFSALLAFYAGNSPVAGEFPAQRPVTQSFDVFFDLRLNIWLSKQ